MAVVPLVVGALLAGAPAHAAMSEDESSLRSWFDQYGISEPTQDLLIEKLETEGSYDAMEGETPVKTTTNESAKAITTIETFADGSINVSEVEKPAEVKPGVISIRSIDGCSVTGGSGWGNWSNCSVNISNGTISMAYKATFERYSGGYGNIISVWGASSSSKYGSITFPTLHVVAKTGNPATAYAAARYKSWNGLQTQNPELWLSVSANSHTSYVGGN
ncbi:hypothetical protein [Arthrobacter sp. ZGTC212]|uniref:hypothetical protein n=1 Tax=Arthrobacter sp. ZGTC212 TaxID=2058899 RepID=UPI0011AFD84C|nr:hypothetical protein [Arthrobacter sp. ZGTC212]